MLSFRLLLLSVLPSESEGDGLYFGEVCLRLAACIPGCDGSRKGNPTRYRRIYDQLKTLPRSGAVIRTFDKRGNAYRYWRAAFLD